ncbi:hypothetical protein Aduo_003677 [Ancylostoma duodenale]
MEAMAKFFWDADGILQVDYLKENATIREHLYANLLFQLRQATKQERRGKVTHGIFLLEDNAPAHSPYNLELVLSYYFLFGNLKQHLYGAKFREK